MGLISGLLLLPLAPARGVVWVAEKLQETAERELYDPGVLRAQLAGLNRDLDEGLLDLEAFEAEEEKLLDRLHAAQMRCDVDYRR
ncbi:MULTISPECIES: gas vesicle protein GvpG [Streptomyces]|uniref:Gas vesicle protein n=2 Tax=Streptomyces TaxID=1883 RepID=A0A1V0U4P7_STRVN|nr:MULTISPECIES: gas vesicle protein GvpG [Streptomyces]ARF60163.1 gas vesicle protein [Streptomyces violaceoruber]KOG82461.1 gas vesicle protein [Streptomyces griseus subsp. rhodochrous]KOU12449.1 gas vesicle protein [Streptomyces sp. NRRL F-2295]KOU47273.1 gas vesicle protein [Streptomyces sp. MMG1522]MBD3544105.1 gas vesicle protein GvpG [Streptomyces sp. JV180]